ncbi:MAG TPA: DEAD/DEAH box helicase [Steroidobacteraceae bacterium]|jgi:ATP-dependent RNA helicase RhlE|nr:DEAD/DEAH box helicase [Steroidobacteraceae bacterium]
MSFDQLGLSAELLRAVSDQGYDTPTPIQLGAIPPVLAGRDLLAAAQTGTGKTAGFALPLLQRLDAENPHPRGPRAPRALVLVPTRELAAQVGESFNDYGRHVHQRTILIFGGVSPRPQVDALRQGVDIVVATPGRLLDHFAERAIDLSQVRHLVLDEADRMLDMGFIRDIRRVLAVLPKKRQNLLFSATFSDEIRTLATGLLHVPVTIEVAARNAPAELVEHRVHLVEQGEKRAVLSHLLREVASEQTLVFTRTKHGANRLADQLARDGIECAAIHGNKSQSARTRALADFKELKVQVLVATDIAARGLDIVELPQVVNYELPHVPEDYVHRIGRTGRAGCAGQALSLVSSDERDRLRAIEGVLGRRIDVLPLDRSGIKFQPERAPPPPPRQSMPAARADRAPHRTFGAPRRQSAGAGRGRRW